MKTSFYFVMWIMIYPILELTGVPFLQENSFFVAMFVVMFGVPYLTRKIFEKDLIYYQQKHTIDHLETIYSNNVAKLKKELMLNIVLNCVVFIYFVSYVVGLLVLQVPDALLQYIVFGVLSILAGSWIVKNAGKYMRLKDVKCFDENSIDEVLPVDAQPIYEQYKAQRATASYQQICDTLGKGGKALKITSIVFSIACILLGIGLIYLWLPIFFADINGEFIIMAMVVYASMAIYYGITDLIQSIRE